MVGRYDTLVFGIFLGLMVFSAGAELKDLDGSVWINEEYNWSLEFQTGQNYSYSNISVENESLRIQDKGISIAAGGSERVNSTLYEYDFSQPDPGDVVLKLGVEAPGEERVDFGFTGVPSISSGSYRLRADEVFSSYDTGGEIEWGYSEWSTAQNFTLTYQDEEDSVSQDSTGGGGSSGFYAPSPGTTSRKWRFVDKNKFEFDKISSDLDVENISVQTKSNHSSFEVSIETAKNPSVPSLEDSYEIYEINTSLKDSEIEEAVLHFSVNSSFVESYDEIVLSRYTSEWRDLPTEVVKSENSKWTYKASSSGFSYYAVRGKVNQEDNTTEKENNSTKESNQTQEDTGTESNQQKDPKINYKLYLTASILSSLLLFIAYIGFRSWRTE